MTNSKEGFPLSTQHSQPACLSSVYTSPLPFSAQGIPASLASAMFVEALSSGHHCLPGLAYICGTSPSSLQIKVSLYPWPQLSLQDSSLPSLSQLRQLGQPEI